MARAAGQAALFTSAVKAIRGDSNGRWHFLQASDGAFEKLAWPVVVGIKECDILASSRFLIAAIPGCPGALVCLLDHERGVFGRGFGDPAAYGRGGAVR